MGICRLVVDRPRRPHIVEAEYMNCEMLMLLVRVSLVATPRMSTNSMATCALYDVAFNSVVVTATRVLIANLALPKPEA
jgi:hypothetical protein